MVIVVILLASFGSPWTKKLMRLPAATSAANVSPVCDRHNSNVIASRHAPGANSRRARSSARTMHHSPVPSWKHNLASSTLSM
jgi:hypothetical protein